MLASLNHPHIAQIYGFEASGDRRALAMELVDGPTLLDLIVTGSMVGGAETSVAGRVDPEYHGISVV